ncbi:hypothetical protein [Streptobacillus moniliformis]|uniref:Uncharacterized protein n=1 Tax=Streptobacillus moniliformis (strain ATCC 14647 / DSM 12112 / NCTC 10651 / 9901) TaxID=519441 RepID=D1AV65_STRM9|nr:hypothetical protein [Streptobacillus moniliformis]ACZ01625.1 hypothetical protein Smon_1170 [Streptobacillus moniliformis DSM 12112]AVL43373.1 hypothetical protein CEP89_05950 [Streptobacillus moniliformis]QXW66303.1 hypothetical protein KX935_03590 [Streptobacillus moniliformis]SQA13196.1 Uncharacterised protein [Streptobacillus moniliformis]
MRNRNFIDSGIFEKANAFSTINSKKMEEIKIEDFLKIFDASLERLEALRDSVKGNGFREKELKEAIGEIIDKIEKTINEQSVRLEKEIPYEKHMEIMKDHDGDGLSTREELERGLDPFSKDSDGNGIDDREELYLSEIEKQKKLEKERTIF